MSCQSIDHATARVDGSPVRRAHLESATDDALLAWVRQGSGRAFTELYKRHYPDSLRYATRLTRQRAHHESPDDIVSEAMRKVLSALQRGHGPTIGFRQYLFTAVRSVTFTARAHASSVNAEEHPDISAPAADEQLDAIVAMEAFESLPYRWRQVLWMTKVDELTPTEIGPLIGLSSNSVAALAIRAREALRIAYVRAHLPHPTTRECRVILDMLAKSSIVPLSSNKQKALTSHLLVCDDCRRSSIGIGNDIVSWSGSVGREFVGADSRPGGRSNDAVAVPAA